MLDAEDTLATFMRQGMPDTKLFRTAVGGILDELQKSALGRGKHLTAFGEMVAVLWQQGHKEAALQLEALWNDALNDRAFHMHCAYPRHSVLDENEETAILGLHSHQARQ
jgi:hypothetical protein